MPRYITAWTTNINILQVFVTVWSAGLAHDGRTSQNVIINGSDVTMSCKLAFAFFLISKTTLCQCEATRSVAMQRGSLGKRLVEVLLGYNKDYM